MSDNKWPLNSLLFKGNKEFAIYAQGKLRKSSARIWATDPACIDDILFLLWLLDSRKSDVFFVKDKLQPIGQH